MLVRGLWVMWSRCGGDADLVLKVKEPVAEEYGRLHEGLVLFYVSSFGC